MIPSIMRSGLGTTLVLMKGTGAMIGLVITTGQEILKGEGKMW